MLANVQRNITDTIFKAQGNVIHSKKFTTAAAPKCWTSYAAKQMMDKREILDSRLRTAEKEFNTTRRGVEALDHLEASSTLNYLNREFEAATESTSSTPSRHHRGPSSTHRSKSEPLPRNRNSTTKALSSAHFENSERT
jgi:hypothetical protein